MAADILNDIDSSSKSYFTFAEQLVTKRLRLDDEVEGKSEHLEKSTEETVSEHDAEEKTCLISTDVVGGDGITTQKTDIGDLKQDSVKEPITIEKQRKVCYIHSKEYIECCDKFFKVKLRASLTHSLIEAYDLLKYMCIIPPVSADEQDISTFHSTDYVEVLRKISTSDDPEKYDESAEQYGLGYDCPAEEGVFEYASLVAGATITAAKILNSGNYDVAINWPGGWHHAKRDEAAGFCYFNDIVLAILTLRQKYERVLYIDLDLHHGDGVEDAFCATCKVFTLSFHKYSAGFFPGTGGLNDVGLSKGKYYAANVPLKDGIQDGQYINIFKKISNIVYDSSKPDAIVCQCGADGMIGDPMASFNLTPKSMATCIGHVLRWNLPTLIVGGGGYNKANTARCWTKVTGEILNRELANDIPEHRYFTLYGPDYELELSPGNRSNENTLNHIDDIITAVTENMTYVSEMHEPRR